MKPTRCPSVANCAGPGVCPHPDQCHKLRNTNAIEGLVLILILLTLAAIVGLSMAAALGWLS